ncbi:MAG: hypothetical protein WA372_12410, partial [Candidatus Sulfotelmatobacter sp.]
MKVNRQILPGISQNASGAKAQLIEKTPIAALKRCATQKHFIVALWIFASLLFGFSASAQDR